MQPNNKFNNHIKEKLEFFQSPIDIDDSWHKLKEKRKEKKKKRILFILFSALGLSSILGTFLYVNFKNNTISESINTVSKTNTDLRSPEMKEKNILTEKNLYDNTNKTKNEVKNQKSSIFSENLGIVVKNVPSNITSSIESSQVVLNQRDSSISVPKLPQLLLSTLNIEDTLKRNTMQKVSENKKRRHLEAFLRFGTTQMNEFHKAKQEGQSSLADFRTKEETNIQTFSYELGLRYPLNNGYFLNLGLNYDDWFSRFKVSQTINKNYQLNNVLLRTITFEPSGQIEKFYGDTIVSGNQTIIGTYYQHHYSLATQVAVGKSFNYKRLAINPSIGFKYYLMNKVKGKAVNDLSNSTFEDSKSIYKNTFWGVSTNVGMSYKLRKNLAVELNWNTTYSISNIANSNYLLKSKAINNGISIGILYKIAE